MDSTKTPKRFRNATLDSYQPKTPSQEAALAAVQSWLERVQTGAGPMLALVGRQGTGKSHLLYAAFREMLATRPEDEKQALEQRWESPYVASWYRLADQLRYGLGRGDSIAEIQVVRNDLWASRIVLLDEVRATSGTNFDDTELARFACHAYDQELAVLITTNVNPLADVMGDAAASRFTELVINGPDWRNPEERAAA